MCKWCRFMFQPPIYHLVTYFLCEGETILQKGKVGVCGSFKKWGGEATYLPDHVSQNMPCSLLIWNYMQEVHFLITFASVIFYASPHMLLDIIKMFPLSLRNSKCRNSGKDYLIKVTLPKHSGSEESLSMKSSFK